MEEVEKGLPLETRAGEADDVEVAVGTPAGPSLGSTVEAGGLDVMVVLMSGLVESGRGSRRASSAGQTLVFLLAASCLSSSAMPSSSSSTLSSSVAGSLPVPSLSPFSPPSLWPRRCSSAS